MLAIEHDWRIRRLIRANLEALGLEVREAVNGQHGLQQLRACRPDLILIDLEIPGIDVEQVLYTLEREMNGQAVPVIVLFADPPARQLLRPNKTTSYLQKPFAAPALLQHVRHALKVD